MNCIIIDDSEFSIEYTKGCITKVKKLNLLASFTEPLKALDYMHQVAEDVQIDIIFLDIEMPDLNGLEFIKVLDRPEVHVILTTAHVEHALESYKYDVTDYLVKPFTLSRFMDAVGKVDKYVSGGEAAPSKEDSMYIKKGNSMVKVMIEDILWMESDGDYVSIHTENAKYLITSTLSKMEKKFPGGEFIRIHRSYIIRFDRIKSIEDSCISFAGKLFPIGKTYKEAVYKRLNIF